MRVDPIEMNKMPPIRLMMNSSIDGVAPRRYVRIIAGTIIANPTVQPIPRNVRLLPVHHPIMSPPSPNLAISKTTRTRQNSQILKIPFTVLRNPVFSEMAIVIFFQLVFQFWTT